MRRQPVGPAGDLGPLAVERSARWREFLEQADDTYLRTNPEGEVFVFSPLHYGAHTRDILKVYGDRMVLGLEQTNPTVPLFFPTEEVFESYNRLDPGELAADIERWAERLATLAAGMEPSTWSRTVTNDRGVYGVYTFTLAGLACNTVHETHHHLLDATGDSARRRPDRPRPLGEVPTPLERDDGVKRRRQQRHSL